MINSYNRVSILGYFLVRGLLWGPVAGFTYALALGLAGRPPDDDGTVLVLLMTMGALFGLFYGLFFAAIAGTITILVAPRRHGGEHAEGVAGSWGEAAFLAACGVALVSLAFGADSATNHALILYPGLIAAAATLVAGLQLPRQFGRRTPATPGRPADRPIAG